MAIPALCKCVMNIFDRRFPWQWRTTCRETQASPENRLLSLHFFEQVDQLAELYLLLVRITGGDCVRHATGRMIL